MGFRKRVIIIEKTSAAMSSSVVFPLPVWQQGFVLHTHIVEEFLFDPVSDEETDCRLGQVIGVIHVP
jgi:hypothetical protein